MTDQATPTPPSFLLQIVASVARHGLTVAAGALAADGVITQKQTTELIDVGIAITLWVAAQGWSYYQKKGMKTALQAAGTNGKTS